MEVENMSIVGYNSDDVIDSINSIQSAYNDLIQAVGLDMQSQFVNAMQDKWYCKYAQDAFETVKKNIDGTVANANYCFSDVVDRMNRAASNYAENTGTAWSNIQFKSNNFKLDVSCIKENVNGNRGVDPEANAVVAQLPSICNSAVNALSAAQNAVQRSGFLGGDTASQLNTSLGNIKSKLESDFSFITNDCKKAIEQTVQTFNTNTANIATDFSNAGAEYTSNIN